MFRSFFFPALCASVLVGCGGGNPFRETPPVVGPGPGDGPGGEADGGVTGLTGTATPSAGATVWRRERTAVGQPGDGHAGNVRYNAVADTFSVDGLAFDGDNIYTRDASINLGSLSGAYRNAETQIDPINGLPIAQLTHRAVYGSNAANTMSFAIVRTGSYQDFGFGGFIYERTGGYSLPAPDGTGNRGDGSYRGQYAGLRDFSGPDKPAGGLEYVTGTARMEIDYDDFNNGHGFNFAVENRRVYDINGADITTSVIASLPGVVTSLPVISTDTLRPGRTDAAGEMTATLYSGPGGAAIGTYYAVLGGANATEVVGIVALNPVADPRFTDTSVRETGGFLLTRN